MGTNTVQNILLFILLRQHLSQQKLLGTVFFPTFGTLKKEETETGHKHKAP